MSYPDRFVWLDLETTGLDPAKEQILELGLLITGSDLRGFHDPLRRSWPIHQSSAILGGMDDWCLRQHGKSGLIADCAKAKESLTDVKWAALRYLDEVCPNLRGKIPMAGCSIHFDRAFLKAQAPELEAWFYYGNLDVSAVEKLARLWYPNLPEWHGRELHRVDPDNEDAIAELSYYRRYLFTKDHTFPDAVLA